MDESSIKRNLVPLALKTGKFAFAITAGAVAAVLAAGEFDKASKLVIKPKVEIQEG